MTASSPLIKPFGLLETIAAAPHAPTLAELTAMVGQPKPTLHRWLAMLEDAALVQRTPDGRRYELAARASRLAFSILANRPGAALRHDILRRTVETVGESCNLTILDGSEVAYLDRVETAWPLRVAFQPGSRVPVHCSASGKLFLALMEAGKRERLLAHLPFERFTDNTLPDRAALEPELRSIRRSRYALDREEYMAGLVCVAVPVFQGEGRARTCVAALALQAPVLRLSWEGAVEKLPILRAAADSLAATLAVSVPARARARARESA